MPKTSVFDPTSLGLVEVVDYKVNIDPESLGLVEVKDHEEDPRSLGLSLVDPDDIREFQKQNPSAILNKDEFEILYKSDKERSFVDKVSAAASSIGEGTSALIQTGRDAALAVAEDPGIAFDPTRNADRLQTLSEAAARGSFDMANLGRKILNNELSQEVMRAIPIAGVIAEATGVIDSPVKDEKEEIDRAYENYLGDKGFDQVRTEGNLLPEVFGKTNNALAEAGSLFIDPTLAVPGLGIAETASKAVLTRGAKIGAKAVQSTGRITGDVIEGAAKIGSDVLDKVPLPKNTAAALAAAGATASGMGPMIGAAITIDGVARGAEKVGELALSAAEKAALPSTRKSILKQIATDGNYPSWIRKTAEITPDTLERTAALAATAGRGALEGAAIGAGLALASDESAENVGAAIGSGGTLGAAGALGNRIATIGKRRIEADNQHVTNWLADKTPDEVSNIGNLNLSREQMLDYADVESLAKGVLSDGQGDVAFKYLKQDEFESRFGKGRGVSDVDATTGTPTIYVNTGRATNKTQFHEVFHALDELEGMTDQKMRVNDELFGIRAADGTTVKEGLYSPEDLKTFETQYRDKISNNPEESAKWDSMTPEKRLSKIQGEVRAEAFANLLGDSKGNFLRDTNTLSRRIRDNLLLDDQMGMLGKMRVALEKAGIDFSASGSPSEIFYKNGKPVTNSATVDAALRDYVRAKDRVTERLSVGEDDASGSTFISRMEFEKKGPNQKKILELYKDWDGFARNPDGSIRMQGDKPVILTDREINRRAKDRAELMEKALDSVPDQGDTGIVRKAVNEKGEVMYNGAFFNDAQVNALKALPNDILSPSIKEKIVQINDILKRQDGSRVLMEYQAALKGKKYSSGIASQARDEVPLGIHLSKAKNLYATGLSMTNFNSKLDRWAKYKKKAFEVWDGNTDNFVKDTFKLLENHQNRVPGETGLDPNPEIALKKKNRINDFINITDLANLERNPDRLSTRGEKDNLWRSRRLDRITRMEESAGDKFPVDFGLQKANFSPDDNP